MQENGESTALTLAASVEGWLVEECRVGLYQGVSFGLVEDDKSTGDRGTLTATGSLALDSGTGSEEFDAQGPRTGLSPLLGLIGTHIRSCAISDGALVVTFDGGVTMTIPPDADYEAWELRTPSGYAVSGPGGALSVW